MVVVQAIVAEVLRRAGQDAASRPDLRRRRRGDPHARSRSRSGRASSTPACSRRRRLLASSILKVLVFNRDYRGPRHAGDARFLAAAASALGCSLLPLHEKANAQGLLDMGATPRLVPGLPGDDRRGGDRGAGEGVVRLAARHGPARTSTSPRLLADKKIKVAVVLGEDPLGSDDLPAPIREGLLAVDFLVVADVFLTRTAAAAHVVLPLSSTAETSGTFTNSERRVQRVRRAIPPRAGYESWEADRAARRADGPPLQDEVPDGTAQVFEEIRRVAPIYRDVVVGSQDGESIWDASPLAAGDGAGRRDRGGARSHSHPDGGPRRPRRAVRVLVRRAVQRGGEAARPGGVGIGSVQVLSVGDLRQSACRVGRDITSVEAVRQSAAAELDRVPTGGR